MVRRTLGDLRDSSAKSGMGWGTLGEAWDRSRDPQRCQGRVGGPSMRCETFRGGPGRVGGNSGMSWMGRGTVREVRDGSEDPWVGPVQVGGPSGKSRTGLSTLVEPLSRFGPGRGTLSEVRNGSQDPRGGPGRVGRP